MAELWPNLKIILAELAVIFKKFGRILFQTVGNTDGKLFSYYVLISQEPKTPKELITKYVYQERSVQLQNIQIKLLQLVFKQELTIILISHITFFIISQIAKLFFQNI